MFRDIYAASSRDRQASLWKTIVAAQAKWGLLPYPPTKEKLCALAAALKAGSYASAKQYLYHYRMQCVRLTYPFSATLDRYLADLVRSCERGVGAPVKALPLPLMRLHELDPLLDAPWVPGGPVGPACAMIAGAWFLTREVELSTTRAALVSLERGSDGSEAVRWFLPASKTDTEARGVSRAHGCACGLAGRVSSCPYHAIEEQLLRLRRLFPERWDGNTPLRDLPLFPDVNGEVVSKDAMTATIVEAAKMLEIAVASPDGSGRVSGHSLRASGAQGLARLGVDTWAIQLLGRWGSSSVLEYVRDAPLETSSLWARRAAQTQSLGDALATCRVCSSSSPVPPSVTACPVLGTEVVHSALSEAFTVAAAAASVEDAPPDVCRYVASPSGKWHRLSAGGLAGATAGWTSACGWRFAGTMSSLVAVLPPGLPEDRLCKKCFALR